MLRFLSAALPLLGSAAALAEEAAPREAPDTMGNLVTWLVSTAAVIVLIVVLGMILKRARFVKRQGGGMNLEGQLALGPKERLVIVGVGGKRVLLGITAQNISFLAELPESGDFKREMAGALKKDDATKKE